MTTPPLAALVSRVHDQVLHRVEPFEPDDRAEAVRQVASLVRLDSPLLDEPAVQAVTEAGNIGAPGGVGWAATAIGTVVSGVVAYASIAWLLKFVASNDFTAFIIYRVLLAGVIITLLLTGVIPAA